MSTNVQTQIFKLELGACKQKFLNLNFPINTIL
jgi:hypothetical protein